MTTLTRRPAAELVIRYRDGTEKRFVRPRHASSSSSAMTAAGGGGDTERRATQMSSVHDACYAAVAQCPPYTASFNSLLEACLPHTLADVSREQQQQQQQQQYNNNDAGGGGGDAVATATLRQLDTRRLAGLVHQRMHAEHIPLATDTYNALMRLVAGSGDGFVFALYEEMKAAALQGGEAQQQEQEQEQQEDTVTKHALQQQQHNSSGGGVGGVVRIVGTSPPNLDTFRTLFRACERDALYQRAFALYRQMRELFGLVPDTTTYNTLLNDCAATGDVAQAVYFVREMRSHGVALDASTYNAHLATLLAAAAPYAEVLRVFHEMADAGVTATNRTYNTVLRATHAHGDYDRAFQLYEEMKKRGCVPDVTTYNVLLGLCEQRVAYVLHGTLRKTTRSRNAASRGGVAMVRPPPQQQQQLPPRRTREQRVRGRRALAELVLTLLAEMDALGVAPNTYSYRAALHALLRCRDDRVFDVYRRYARDVAAAAAMTTRATGGDGSNGGVQHNKEGDNVVMPVDVALDVSGEGVCACAATYKIMLRACLVRGRVERCRDVYTAALQQQQQSGGGGVRLDGELLYLALRACALTRSRTWAEQILDDARAAHAHVDTRVYNAYLSVLAAVAARPDDDEDARVEANGADAKGDNDWRSVHGHDDDDDNNNALTVQRAAAAELFARFEEMRLGINEFGARADADTYNVVLQLCACQPHLHARARELFAGMCDVYARDVPRANVRTYCLMLDLHAAAGDVDAAARLLDEAVAASSRLRHDNNNSSSSDKNDEDAGNEGNEDEDEDDDDDDDDGDDDDVQQVHALPRKRDKDVVCVYHRLMRMYVSMRDARIVHLFDTLKHRHNNNSSSSSNHCGSSRGGGDDMDAAVSCAVPALDVRCYNLRMEYHLACGAYADVLACFAELKVSSTLEPNAATYDVLLRLHSRLGDRKAILALFDDARMHSITLTPTMYNTILRAFLGTSDDVFVFDVLRDMRANGLAAAEDTLAIFIASAAGRRVLGEAVARGLLAPPTASATARRAQM